MNNSQDQENKAKQVLIHYSNGEYFGEISNGMRNGFGKMTYCNISKDKESNKLQSTNIQSLNCSESQVQIPSIFLYKFPIIFKCKYIDGRVYEGEWQNDLRHGQGTEKYSNGDSYVGNFQDGKAHGKGIYTWK